MRRWWAWAQWVVIPIAVLGMAETVVRSTVDRRPRWYGAAEQAVADGPVNALFVGSSRVEAAVYVPAFEEEASAMSRACVRALNLGRGYSTAAEHYLGLRNLFAAHPEHLSTTTVFVEMPLGPAGPSQWRGSWAHDEQPWMLVDLLRWHDLRAFGGSSGLPLGEKIHLTVRFVLRGVMATFNRRERIREELLRRGIPWVLDVMRRRPLPEGNSPLAATRDLIGLETDIRRDPVSLRRARDLAIQVTGAWVGQDTPVHEWQESIERDLVEMVERQGGRVVFFKPPLSSVFTRLDRNPGRQKDLESFGEQAQRWGAAILTPHVEFTDEDFPDLWHADHQLALRFSRELARDWLRTLGTGALAGGATPSALDSARAAGRSTCPPP